MLQLVQVMVVYMVHAPDQKSSDALSFVNEKSSDPKDPGLPIRQSNEIPVANHSFERWTSQYQPVPTDVLGHAGTIRYHIIFSLVG